MKSGIENWNPPDPLTESLKMADPPPPATHNGLLAVIEAAAGAPGRIFGWGTHKGPQTGVPAVSEGNTEGDNHVPAPRSTRMLVEGDNSSTSPERRKE